MDDMNRGAVPNQPATSRFAGVAKGDVDRVRRALTVAARKEMSQIGEELREGTVGRLTSVARPIGMMLGGASIAAVGSIYVVDGVVRALSTRISAYLASLLTGTAIALGGLALLERGRRQLGTSDGAPSGDDAATNPPAQ
jgi:hypothetical protein